MRFLKRSFALVVTAVALAVLLGSQILRYERRVAAESAAAASAISPEPATPRKAGAHHASRARHWAFGGYPCRGSDCSEDKAGYRWAEANSIADPDDCTGKTGSFIEGCRVYARQQTR
jgi:hypothetical protein